MYSILLIDDDRKLAKLLQEYFLRFDLALYSATTPAEGFCSLRQNAAIDLVILDVMLPAMDGFTVCKRIREDSAIPIIMLTARGEITDRVVGFEIGANDYLPKPFEPRELVARVYNLIKLTGRAYTVNATAIRYGDLRINQQQVMVGDRVVAMTSRELAVLYLLAKKPEAIFSRDAIMRHISGVDTAIFSRAVDILVSRVRRKLHPLDCIQTVRNRGYRFSPPQ